jgi:hypothetical protein
MIYFYVIKRALNSPEHAAWVAGWNSEYEKDMGFCVHGLIIQTCDWTHCRKPEKQLSKHSAFGSTFESANSRIQFRSVYIHTAGDKDILYPLQNEWGPSRYGRSGKVRNVLPVLGIAVQFAGDSASREWTMNCTQCGKVNFNSHCEFHDKLLCNLRLLLH